MLFQEALNIFLLDTEADELICGDIALIVDRNTNRVYLNNGVNYNPTVTELASPEWIVRKYGEAGAVIDQE